MKKTMKTMLAFVAGAVLLAGCAKEEINVANGPKLVTLTAYQEGDDASKAAIDATDSKKIDWTAGDKINYFGGATGQSMTLKTGAGTTSGTFEGEVTTGSADYVLYPYQSAAANNAGVITAEVPMTQYAVANSFDPAAALMVGAVDAGTGSVEFKNVMSYVKVTIPSDMTNCKQVSIKAKDAWTTVAGKVNITASTGEWAETTAKEGQAFVRLVPKAPATKLEAGTAYYIAILPQDMTTGFELIFNDNDVIKVKQSASSSVVFGRSKTKKLGDITSFTYTVGTINLTPKLSATLYLADRNIGAATTDAYGDYFAWAALRPAYITRTQGADLTDATNYREGGFTQANAPYYNGSAYTKYTSTDKISTIESCDDIAAMLWGGDWRLPTNKELYDNAKVGSSLPLFSEMTKSGMYDGNKISYSDYGYYWEADAAISYSQALFVVAHSSTQSTECSRYYGLAVRPVLAPITGADLSASETANCYIISGAGEYKFKATKGNSDETPVIKNASVLWESFGDETAISAEAIIHSVHYSNGYITFKATGAKGNALIRVGDNESNSSTSSWSWHIWVTDKPEDQVYYGGATMMDRNLGATSTTPGDVKALGCLYQWGRKDPFLATGTINGTTRAANTGKTWYTSECGSSNQVTVGLSIQTPTYFYTNAYNDWLYTSDDTLWGDTKTKYDPCPAGYRVPSADVFANAFAKKTASASFNSEMMGCNMYQVFGNDASIWYPAAGLRRRDNGTFENAGKKGYYWTNKISGTNYQAWALMMDGTASSVSIDAKQSNTRAWGFSVRCQKIQ